MQVEQGSLCPEKPPRAWFGRFTTTMTMFGHQQSNADHNLFLKRKNNHITFLIIYEDDIIITGDDKEEVSALKEQLYCEFEMKDLRKLPYFLGIEISKIERRHFHQLEEVHS